jgi:hypothetical protein
MQGNGVMYLTVLAPTCISTSHNKHNKWIAHYIIGDKVNTSSMDYSMDSDMLILSYKVNLSSKISTEISSLPDGKLAKWSTASYALALNR